MALPTVMLAATIAELRAALADVTGYLDMLTCDREECVGCEPHRQAVAQAERALGERKEEA